MRLLLLTTLVVQPIPGTAEPSDAAAVAADARAFAKKAMGVATEAADTARLAVKRAELLESAVATANEKNAPKVGRPMCLARTPR